ncbi:MAG: GTP-binding protein, partial [Candidatus Wildermuthbacteria bacterium]|nr:GTP-binding protein [Candidatus Wildermuthbacteria bacterium]
MRNKKEAAPYIRPPVVVMLGHVDHGKSSLLEAIREEFTIIKKESGGITQHIGAYEAGYKGRSITFLDTPGHEAFSAMRSRGARIADIAVLVVAAEEGVKPQTKEAIAQAHKANVPMVVAIHKVDKPEANPERVKMELSQAGVMVEGYGGNVPFVLTSAKTKQGIPDLLEMILLMADMEAVRANPELSGEGVVLESSIDNRRGILSTLLVTDGTLVPGAHIATRSACGKVKILEDFRGDAIERALPSMPAVVVGFEKSPAVGEEWKTFEKEEEARAFLAI